MDHLSQREQQRLAGYYDEDGKLKQFPSKKNLRMAALEKIAAAFSPDQNYTEKEVNEIIWGCIVFSDHELIRRELIENNLLHRLRDGTKYWKA